MSEQNERSDQVSAPEGETVPTSLLRKRRQTGVSAADSDTATPPTPAQTDGTGAPEEKAKSKTVAYVVAGVVAAVLVAAAIWLSTGRGGGFFSGGSGVGTDKSEGGATDVVEGRAKAEDPEPREAGDPATPHPAGQGASPAADAQPEPQPQAAAPPPAAAPAQAEPERSTPSPRPPDPNPAPVASEARPAQPKPVPAADAVSMGLQEAAKSTATREGDLVALTGDVTPPVKIREANIQKPAMAKQLKKSGTAVVRILVDESGDVAKTVVVSEAPAGFGFGKAAAEAAGMYKYRPAVKGSVRVKVWLTVPFRFE